VLCQCQSTDLAGRKLTGGADFSVWGRGIVSASSGKHSYNFILNRYQISDGTIFCCAALRCADPDSVLVSSILNSVQTVDVLSQTVVRSDP
jgi:hypothetical protein